MGIQLFWRQFSALFVKNLVVFRKHWIVNLLRCLILPVAYGIFLAYAQNFFKKPNNYGLGNAIPVFKLEDHFDGSSPLVWADNTDGSGYLSASDIMNRVTSSFTAKQHGSVRKVKNSQEVADSCLSNFSGASDCFVTVTFEGIPSASSSDTRGLNYTIRSDNGIFRSDVSKHTSDAETKVIPLQWAIDRAIIQLTTGQETPTPLELPYTWTSSSDSFDSRRLLFLSLIGFFGGIAFFLAFSGIVYQIAGGVALERANLLTCYMQCMGALDSARIMSWHISLSLLYLPVWIILAFLWRSQLFVNTDIGLMISIHLLTGLGLASWSFFVSTPFSKSPQLAAAFATGFAIVVGVIPMMLYDIGPVVPAVLSFFFPSMFFVFCMKGISGFELDGVAPDVSVADPNYGYTLMPMIIAALVGIFVWPCLAIWWERAIYRVSNPNAGLWTKRTNTRTLAPGIALSLRSVRKIFNPSFLRLNSKRVTAIADLTLDVPSYGIFVLLGPNGAGKSTTLSILSGLTTVTSGDIIFEGNTSRPLHGDLGIVPQQNVLFPELSCLETLRVWNAIKAPSGKFSSEDLEQLILDCDLQEKMHSPAGTLSGGQKRKLQLAIGLVGGSKIILVDECTSGVDPLSRRALWRTLTAYRKERTIVLTTHFLDEADFLADQIAVLAAPGKLIASDTPVALKSTMGEGYSISVKFASSGCQDDLLHSIKAITTDATLTSSDIHNFTYHLKTKDVKLVAKGLRLVEDRKAEFSVLSYDLLGTTIEEIFLDLLAHEDKENSESHLLRDTDKALARLTLSSGRPRAPWAQAMTIFHKRVLILRRSWFAPLLAMAVGISGALWPTRFLEGGLTTCAHEPFRSFSTPLFPPRLYDGSALAAPLSFNSLANSTLPEIYDGYSRGSKIEPFEILADQAAVVDALSIDFRNYSRQGAIVMDFDKNEFLIAYEAYGAYNLKFFSIASNLFYNRALNASGSASGSKRINPSYDTLPTMPTESLNSLMWLVIFGAALSVYPAFFALYVAKERHSSIQAMQLSNGLSNPLGLWLGHLMFDSIFTIIIATVIAIAFSVMKEKFQGIGLLWFVMCLYGFVATLLSYIAAVLIKSRLGAFGAMVVSQFIIYLLYLTGNIITLFSASPKEVPRMLNMIHFLLALVAPINSLARAGIVSVNLFSTLCEGENIASGTQLVSITRFGGPILYLFLWAFALLFVLAQVDTGVRIRWPKFLIQKMSSGFQKHEDIVMANKKSLLNQDVVDEAEHATSQSTDPLRVLNVSKTFDGNKVVDDVSFTIPHNSLFVLLGPNGAGKTTTFDMIRGQTLPDTGDVVVNNTSVVLDTKKARVSFGVCPQFTAIDDHLSVREHLLIYGRLKGLNRGTELQHNVDSLMAATGLDTYADRLATKLSGGNQRKLALAIALIGNPPVVLVDEYSTGVDAKMKRELWAMLKHVTANKSVFLTTHSMEEASYLATKAGIMSRRMLAIGSPEELESRNASYEVHFSCRTREDLIKVQAAMTRIPGARMADDVATRFEVPIRSDEQRGIQSVADLFETLSEEEDFPEFTIGKSTLETAFIRIINEDAEENGRVEGKRENPSWFRV